MHWKFVETWGKIFLLYNKWIYKKKMSKWFVSLIPRKCYKCIGLTHKITSGIAHSNAAQLVTFLWQEIRFIASFVPILYSISLWLSCKKTKNIKQQLVFPTKVSVMKLIITDGSGVTNIFFGKPLCLNSYICGIGNTFSMRPFAF